MKTRPEIINESMRDTLENIGITIALPVLFAIALPIMIVLGASIDLYKYINREEP